MSKHNDNVDLLNLSNADLEKVEAVSKRIIDLFNESALSAEDGAVVSLTLYVMALQKMGLVTSDSGADQLLQQMISAIQLELQQYQAEQSAGTPDVPSKSNQQPRQAIPHNMVGVGHGWIGDPHLTFDEH